MCVKRFSLVIFLLFICLLAVPFSSAELTNLDKNPSWLSASGTFSTNEDNNAIDDNNATQWISGGEWPNWWKITYPSAREITRVSFNNYGGEQNGIYSFLFQWSDDDTNWVNGWEKTTADGVLYNYSFINESMGVHKYWRLYSLHRDTGTNYAIIEEFYAWNGTPDIPVPEVNTLLLNRSKKTLNLSAINEDLDFYVSANYTSDGITLIGGVCNFTAYNISAHFLEGDGVNFTLNNSGDILSLVMAEGNTSALSDTVGFTVCRENIKQDLQILKDGNLFSTIDQNLIPLCSVGTHIVLESTTAWLNDSNVNISLNCVGCDSGLRRLRIVNLDGERLHLDRQFYQHIEPLTFNASNSLYEYTNHLYHYKDSALNLGNISTNCNGTTDSQLFNVGNLNLTVNVLSINSVAFVEGMNLESTNLTTILLDIVGDTVASIDFNVSYSNGSLIKQNDTERLTLTNEQLNINGIYNISIVAIDDDGNPTTLKTYFTLNDTTAPVLFWFSPLKNNISFFYLGYNVTLNFSIYDINLYAYNISIYRPDGTSAKNITNIGNTGHGLINITGDINASVLGNWSVMIEATDSHHLTGEQLLDAMPISKTKDNLVFDNKLNIYAEGALYSEVYKNKYSYSYEFVYSKQLIKKYVVSSNSYLEHIPNSVYGAAHFVDYKNRLWIDFYGVGEVPIIKRLNSTAFEVTFNNLPDIVKFDSVGVLNTVIETARYEVKPIPIMPENVSINCLTNEAPAFENKMAWLCILNTTKTDRFECNSYVEIEGRVIQVNPSREVIDLYGISETFKERKGLINAYFTTENLRISPEHSYNFIVKCSHNETTIAYNTSVKPDYVAPVVFVDRFLWAKDNPTYIMGGFVVTMLILLFGIMWFNWIVRDK